MNNKPLALTQSCSTKKWNKKVISFISDPLVNKKLGSWDEISKKYEIPRSQKKTYTLLSKVIGKEKVGKILNWESFIKSAKWIDGNGIDNTSTKKIYGMFKCDKSVLLRVANCWGSECPFSNWQFFFEYFWSGPYEEKIIHFRWFLLIKKLAIGSILSSINIEPMICSLCN